MIEKFEEFDSLPEQDPSNHPNYHINCIATP